MVTWWGTLGAWVRLRRVEIALVLLLALFVPLSLIATSTELRQWDVGITRAIQRDETPYLTTIASAMTAIGNGLGLFILALPCVLYLQKIRRPIGGIFLVATISGHVLQYAVKAFFNRPRPRLTDNVQVLLPASGSSFPSGHAMTAVMFFGFLLALIAVNVAARSWRRAGITLCIMMILSICFSRIYLGAHFLSDVIGGIACGLFFLILWTQVYKRVAPQEFILIASGAGDVVVPETEPVSS